MSLLRAIIKVGVPVALTAAAYTAAKMRELYAPAKEKPHSDAPIIVALGDSITFGAGVKPTRKSDSWEAKLEKLLGGSYQVLNYGISGATLQDEADMPYWNMPQKILQGYPEAALALNPDIVILMLGTNDSKPYNWDEARFKEQLKQRVSQLKQEAKRLIVMCPPFCCPAEGSDVVAFDIVNETIRDVIVPAIEACAAEYEVECINLYTLTDGHPEYFMDGVHPNSFGNRVIAAEIHRYLTEHES